MRKPDRNSVAQLVGYQIVRQGEEQTVVDRAGMPVGAFVALENDTVQAVDTVEAAGDFLIRWHRTYRLKPGQPAQRVRLTMDFCAAYKSRFALIPGISFNGNSGDPGNVYHGFALDGVPWSFAWHRTLIPGATYSEGERQTVALFGDVGDPQIGLACSLLPGENTTTHRLIFPEEEMPKRVLVRENGLSPGRANVLELKPGQIFQATAWLVVHPVERPHLGYRTLLDIACLNTWAAKAGPQYAFSSQTDRSAMAGSVSAEAIRPFLGSWRVVYNNGAVSNLTFQPNGRIGDSPYWGSGTLRAIAEGLGCNWAHGQQETYRLTAEGKLAVEHWNQGMRFTGVGVLRQGPALFSDLAGDANNLAAGASAFFRASTLAEKCGLHRPQYRALALAICDAALAVQQKDGHFEAAGCNRGTIGANFLPILLTAYETTKDEKYLRGAVNADRFFMDQFYHDGYVWGSSLDTQSIDFESIAPLLEGNIRLYERTGDNRYLTQAEDAAYYDALWQIAQSIPNPPGSLMETIHYESFGVHSVATVHQCAHAFGLADFRSLWKLAQFTHKAIWQERAVAVWNNATIGISDGTFAPMGETPRPYGSQDETYDYTDWGIDYPWAYHLDRAHPRGSGSEWLVAWPTAMRLTILADPELRTAIEALPVKPLRN